MTIEQEKQALRDLICRAARDIAQSGYVAANDGNLSARCSDGTILITPSGVYKGDVEPGMLAELDGEGWVLAAPGGQPSSETPMHLALYQRHGEIGGVVHTHSPYALCMASLGRDLTEALTADMVLWLGQVPCLPYLPLGGGELAQAVARAGDGAKAVLLAHHGAVTWGKDIKEAWYRTQALEQYCRQLYLQMCLGRPRPQLPDEAVRALERRKI